MIFVYFNKLLLSERSNVVVISVPRNLIIYVVLYIEEDAPPPSLQKKIRLRGRLVKYIRCLQKKSPLRNANEPKIQH